MSKEKNAVPTSCKPPAIPWRIVRLFDGTRTAEQVVLDLIKVHNVS